MTALATQYNSTKDIDSDDGGSEDNNNDNKDTKMPELLKYPRYNPNDDENSKDK